MKSILHTTLLLMPLLAAPALGQPVAGQTTLGQPVANTSPFSSPMLPAPYRWAGGEPVEDLGFSHGRVVLNGVWRFQPAPAPDAPPLETPASWGAISVPGTWSISVWNGNPNVPGLVVIGQGEAWKGAEIASPKKRWYDPALLWKVPQAWYERRITVPATWSGRQILLDVRRVSTDAAVFVDGQPVGNVAWPYGTVDLTAAVKPGSTHTLRLLVSANQTEAQTLKAMGVGQNTLVDAKLETRGINGEVFLISRPGGGRIDDVWVKTSVRKRQLAVDAELVGVRAGGAVEFTAVVKDGAGKIARTFRQTATVKTGDSTVPLAWTWPNPKLWDYKQPNLYTLELTAKGAGLNVGLRQVFGFRELWIEGKNVMFNGTPFRLRPTSNFADGPQSITGGYIPLQNEALDDVLNAGFNCLQLWPRDYTVRGTFNYRENVCEMADRKGLPIIGGSLSAAKLFSGGKDQWFDPLVRANWEKALRAEWRRYRNYPSIVIWGTTANVGGSGDDQDPRRIGRRLSDPAWAGEATKNPRWWQHHQGLDELTKVVKALDPTRPVFVHQAGPVGDLYAVNNYLNLIPLQEREEWLSDWKQNGTMPYTAVEFGTPLDITMNRGRKGYTDSSRTEWLMTEFCASYLGRDAYRLEQSNYRESIIKRHMGDQLYNWLGEFGQGIVDEAPAFQKLEELFVTNTWRSWRTMGLTGGMIPWSEAHGFKPIPGLVPTQPFQPGQRGTWFAEVPNHARTSFGGPGVEVLPSGRALLANNGPTLAWICGPARANDEAAFTSKDHSFYAGSRLSKRAALINDTRAPQTWSIRAVALLGGKPLGAVTRTGRIAVGQNAFVPLDFMLPAVAAGKRDGEIRLDARIGTQRHTDRFAFRVFAPAPAPPVGGQPANGQPVSGNVQIFDPSGETGAMLKRLGIAASAWTGGKASLLVVGRGALSSGGTPPGDLERFVRGGGRLLLMAQDPDWTEKNLGLRISHLLTRRVFRLDDAHPVVAGLDDNDLRDWTGASTLMESRPDYSDPKHPRNRAPLWGWRWGGRGAVTSVAIEKPHRAGWRPLLECEFDLQYSPLMELTLGQGRMVFCTLDLEDHAPQDPAAALLARNLFGWLRSAPVTPRTETVYVGNDEGAALLDLLGAQYRRAATIEAGARLVVLGPDISAEAAAPVLAAGGKVLVLPRRAPGEAGLGLQVVKRSKFLGSLSVPTWPEAAGLSPGDVRWRNEDDALVLQGGDQIASDGLLARVVRGKGVAVFCQSDPLTLPADTKDYLRFTRWRQTRTLTQLLANLGGSFQLDNRVLNVGQNSVPLAGDWKVAWTNKLPTATAAFPDPGITVAASNLVRADADESAMRTVTVPAPFDEMGSADGEAVFRKHFQLPAAYAGQELTLNMGVIDDFDAIFINGVQVGATTAANPNWWTIERTYSVPSSALKTGDNVIAVRVFDNYGGGGLSGPGTLMNLRPKQELQSLYHPDYRRDFAMGDDPYRYFRW